MGHTYYVSMLSIPWQNLWYSHSWKIVVQKVDFQEQIMYVIHPDPISVELCKF